MDGGEVLRAVLALTFVLGLILVCAMAVRRFGWVDFQSPAATTRRLALVESLTLDPRHRLLLVRCDDRDHMLVLGPSGCHFAPAPLPAKAHSPAAGSDGPAP